MNIKRNVQDGRYVMELERFGDVDTSSIFFNPFRECYGDYYESWLYKKRDDEVLVVKENDKIIGFLKLKLENLPVDFEGIYPPWTNRLRLKISSLRTLPEYPGLGSKLMHIVFAFATRYKVEEIYGTVPIHLSEIKRVNKFFVKWGFSIKGIKSVRQLKEYVYVYEMGKELNLENLFSFE